MEGSRTRRAVPEDARRVAELLDLNGLSRHMALGRHLVAIRADKVLAALECRVEGPRLVLGHLVSHPLASERLLARVLYAEAHALARETGLEEVRAAPPAYGDYPYEVGYRRGYGCWRLEADAPLRLRVELPGGGWRRLLALWCCTTGPFFLAFRDPNGQRLGGVR